MLIEAIADDTQPVVTWREMSRDSCARRVWRMTPLTLSGRSTITSFVTQVSVAVVAMVTWWRAAPILRHCRNWYYVNETVVNQRQAVAYISSADHWGSVLDFTDDMFDTPNLYQMHHLSINKKLSWCWQQARRV